MTTPTEKCCEQCIERGDFRGEIYHIDPDCPCHSPTENSWEEKVEDAVFAIEGGTSRSTKIRIITELARHIEQEAYERGKAEEREKIVEFLEARVGIERMDGREDVAGAIYALQRRVEAALNERTD